jgi:hypothetical protein
MTRRFSSGASMLGIAAVILVLISCSTPQTRISDHPDLYQSLSSRDQALVSQGQIRSGMSRSAVWLAWGSPDQKIVGNMAGTLTETWIYIYYATYPYYPYYGPGPWGPWASNDSGPGYGRGRPTETWVYLRYETPPSYGAPYYYGPFDWSYIPPKFPYPSKGVTFANGRVVFFRHLPAPPPL